MFEGFAFLLCFLYIVGKHYICLLEMNPLQMYKRKYLLEGLLIVSEVYLVHYHCDGTWQQEGRLRVGAVAESSHLMHSNREKD